MADSFTATVNSSALLAMMDRVGPSLAFHTRDVARETAVRITAEAKARVARRTGETSREIHWEMSKDEKGYVVLAYDTTMNKTIVDVWLETGTKWMNAQPWFFASALIENGPHLRRMEERIQTVLDDLGR